MSRSPEQSSRDRRMSMDSNHSRPEQDEVPSKRMRTDARVEDKARSKRMFGNLLGTLQKFKKEDKTSRTSEAAKRREQVSERIAAKIRSETTLHHEIAESERELKALRISTESGEFQLKHKAAAMSARHASLRPISKFLHTSLPPPAPLIFETNLLNPSPIPLNHGPSREPPNPNQLKPLYFLPKILLPQQEGTLKTRIANIEELITDESTAIESEKTSFTETAKKNRERISELSEKLEGLRKQVRRVGADGKGERDDFGRTPRDEMDIDREGTGDREADREAGVQIAGEDGDVEVEY